MGEGVIPWAFPFSMDRVELAVYGLRDTGPMMLAALVAIAVMELGARLRSRRTTT